MSISIPTTATFKKLANGDSLRGHIAAMFGGQTGTTTYSSEFWLLWLFDNGKIGWQKPSIAGRRTERTIARLTCLRWIPGGARRRRSIPAASMSSGGRRSGTGAVDKDQ